MSLLALTLGPCWVVQSGLEFVILIPHYQKSWGFRYGAPHPVGTFFFFKCIYVMFLLFKTGSSFLSQLLQRNMGALDLLCANSHQHSSSCLLMPAAQRLN